MTLRQRILGRSGIRVSDMWLGSMTFGTSWGWGADADVCREMYAAFRDAGGNVVDTAPIYTGGEAEQIVGQLVAGERDQIVLSTKFTLTADADPNAGGSHRKSLRQSVEGSLRRLGTDYLDVLFVHAWDQHTPVDETMKALDGLVTSGKVLAIGTSNTPAWVVARGDAIAETRGWARFSAIQLEYSLIGRTSERDLLPMAASLGMAVAVWSPLGRGLLAGKPPLPGTPIKPMMQAGVDECAAVAGELGVSAARVAVAWVMGHGYSPIIGATKLAQVTDNLAAAELTLDADMMKRLDAATAPSLGYPLEFLTMFPHLS